MRDGEEVRLTPVESRLLYALAANLGQTVPTETLLMRGWSETEAPTPATSGSRCVACGRSWNATRTIPVYLETIRGVGYRLEVEPT